MRLQVQAHVAKLDNAAKMTIGEVMEAVGSAQSDEEAQAIKRAYLARIHRDQPQYSDAEAEDVFNQNVGYWTGYLNHEEGARILKLYAGSYHPVFGTRHVEGKVTPEEAMEAGRKAGAEAKQRALQAGIAKASQGEDR